MKKVKSSKIKEIILNPVYVTNENFESLKIQGLPVRWMREDESNNKKIFTILVDE